MYILESLGKPGLPYVGITTDINRRADEHNKRGKGGKGAGSWFTSFNGPWKMICNITGFNLTGFRACELKLKSIMPKSKYTGASGKILALIYCLTHQDEFWDKPKKYPISEGDYKI
jgi:predicted GIY-YIG superfamily endonuclease